MQLKLNCDMGESFGIYKMGYDETIMPLIDMANLACGFHASDALTMAKSVRLAMENGAQIGAHPSYQDLVGFGRRSMQCSLEEIKAIVLYQMGALDGIARAFGIQVTYVKPHGALYNDMMRDENIFRAICSAVSSYDANVKLMVLSSAKNEELGNIALSYGVSLLYEIFADRNYNDDGSLVGRMYENAVIEDELEVIERIENLKNNGYLESINGHRLFLKANTICVHGDNEKAVELVEAIRKIL